jgi:beta-glucosidase
MREEYGTRDLYVTENGCASEETRPVSGPFRGRILDLERREFLRSYLLEGRRAVAEGLGLKGWFVWSLLDNFEWAEGYAKRFGLVHVDYRTQERTLKESGRWYRDVARSGKIL